MLGDGARDRGALADLIPTDPEVGAGVAYVRLETDPDPVRPRRLGVRRRHPLHVCRHRSGRRRARRDRSGGMTARAARPPRRKKPPAPTAHVGYQPTGPTVPARRARRRDRYHAVADQAVTLGQLTRDPGQALCGQPGP